MENDIDVNVKNIRNFNIKLSLKCIYVHFNDNFYLISCNHGFAIKSLIHQDIKSNEFENIILGFEVGARYTFTDNLDGSFPKNKNLHKWLGPRMKNQKD